MNKKVLTIVTLILALAPIVLVAALYGRLPDRIPMHWDLGGNMSYGSKGELWIVTVLPLLLLFLFKALPKVDPRKKNYARFQTYYDGFCFVMMLFLLGMICLMVSEALWPGRLSVARVIIVGVGVLFVFLGNILPKVKNNFFMGVRTPWTLSDPDVWNRANRLGGQSFFVLGVAMVIGGLLLSLAANFVLMLAGIAIAALVPTVMSYIWYRQKHTGAVDKEDTE